MPTVECLSAWPFSWGVAGVLDSIVQNQQMTHQERNNADLPTFDSAFCLFGSVLTRDKASFVAPADDTMYIGDKNSTVLDLDSLVFLPELANLPGGTSKRD